MSDVKPETSGDIDICSACRKPIKSSRKGSMTSWIFSSGYCTCSATGSGELLNPKINRNRATKRTAEYEKPNRTNLDENGFPLLGSRYKITDPIGIGGMGEIYRVREEGHEGLLAVKLLRDEYARDKTCVNRLKKEALTASSLSHPNIIQVMGYSSTPEGKPYLVMEYVDGISLEELIEREGHLDWRRVLNLIIQICEGLSYAHHRGVIHRDLKPSNVIITRSKTGMEHAKILDLGISKQINNEGLEDKTKLTQTGDVIGSPLYMSPEQCQGEAVDSRSDIYSLACLACEALTGESPFQAENSVKVILNHINMDRNKILENLERHQVPGAFARLLVDKCLAVSPQNRIDSVTELSKKLWTFANQSNTAIYKVKGYSRKNRKTVAVAAALPVVALCVYGGTILQGYYTENEKTSVANNQPKPALKETKSLPSTISAKKIEKKTVRPVEKPEPKAEPKAKASAKPIETKPVAKPIAKSVPKPVSRTPPRTIASTIAPVTKKTQPPPQSKPKAVYVATVPTAKREPPSQDKKQARRLKLFRYNFPRGWVRVNFGYFDRDRNGYISSQEAGSLWRWLNRFDINGDTYVSQSEVSLKPGGINKKKVPLPRIWILANFDILDTDRNSYISQKETPFLWHWIKRHDLNRDGYVSTQEVQP